MKAAKHNKPPTLKIITVIPNHVKNLKSIYSHYTLTSKKTLLFADGEVRHEEAKYQTSKELKHLISVHFPNYIQNSKASNLCWKLDTTSGYHYFCFYRGSLSALTISTN